MWVDDLYGKYTSILIFSYWVYFPRSTCILGFLSGRFQHPIWLHQISSCLSMCNPCPYLLSLVWYTCLLDLVGSCILSSLLCLFALLCCAVYCFIPRMKTHGWILGSNRKTKRMYKYLSLYRVTIIYHSILTFVTHLSTERNICDLFISWIFLPVVTELLLGFCNFDLCMANKHGL
jgi:hypothetical protein